MEEIVNRVAKSPLVSIDLDEFIHKGEKCLFDLKDVLFDGLILKEKDFREFLKSNDWSAYHGKNVGLVCSTDAIVPIWAYMLLATSLNEHANTVVFGSESDVEKTLIDQAIGRCIKSQNFEGAKVVIKGCGEVQNKEYAYTQITNALLPTVTSLMYGEPCSTVPIFKKRK
ncbi:MAG: DUF2480 family protein [Cyclobacteriaceae bacterium]